MSGILLRLALRRDRVLLPMWLVGITAMVVFSVIATNDMYGDLGSLVSAAETINATGALVALYGKVYDPTSLGAVAVIKLTAFGASLIAVLFVFLVVRHSRAEEESGRLELVASGAVRRSAPLLAALAIGIGGSIALGGLTAIGVALAGLPIAGSIAFGVSWALSGMVFSGLAAVAAQVARSARAAIGLGMAGVAAAYALRAIGDLSEGDPGVASWLSPIGWSQQIRPFAGDRWWVISIPLAATLVLVLVAFLLQKNRDLGGGLLSDRPGPAEGRIGSAAGLAWRLQRGSFAAWLVGLVAMGAVLGSIADNVSGLLDAPQMREYLALLGGRTGLVDAFLAAEVAILGAITSAYAATAVIRLRSEESGGRADVILSTNTRRWAWVAGHTAIGLGGVGVLLVATGAAIGLAYGLTIDEAGTQFPRMVGAAAAQIPAAWVLGGIAVLLFGIGARWVSIIWGFFVAFIVVGEFGSLWGLPEWVMSLSPFAHSPRLPSEAVNGWELAALVGVAAIGVTGGLILFNRRDISA